MSPRKRLLPGELTRSWPMLVGAVLLAAGVAMLAASPLLADRARASASLSQKLKTRTEQSAVREYEPSSSAAQTLVARPIHTHWDDIDQITRSVQRHGLNLGATAYQQSFLEEASLTIRHVDLSVESDYPALKAFLAELLTVMPHVYVEEIRIDQRGAERPGLVRAAVKLAIVYRPAPSFTAAGEAGPGIR